MSTTHVSGSFHPRSGRLLYVEFYRSNSVAIEARPSCDADQHSWTIAISMRRRSSQEISFPRKVAKLREGRKSPSGVQDEAQVKAEDEALRSRYNDVEFYNFVGKTNESSSPCAAATDLPAP